MINRINKHWTNEEDMFISDNVGKFTRKQLAKILGRSLPSIDYRLRILNLQKGIKTYAYYKGEKLIAIGTADELAKEIGVKRNTIYWYSNPNNDRGNIAVVSLED